MNNKMSAKHTGSGVWQFTCEAHDEPIGTLAVSSPKGAMEVMRDHVDVDHPGQRFTLRRQSSFSGNAGASYTGKTARLAEDPSAQDADSEELNKAQAIDAIIENF